MNTTLRNSLLLLGTTVSIAACDALKSEPQTSYCEAVCDWAVECSGDTASLESCLEATRAVIVAEHAPSVAEAQAQLRAGKVDGVVLIARGLQRQLRTGAPGAGIAVWVNASYLLRASTIGRALSRFRWGAW